MTSDWRAGLPIGAIVLVLMAAGTSPARADLTRQSNAIVGERPLGFGGAFTGLADSPAATYYNPAGLASLRRHSASASLSLQVVERLQIDDAYLTTAGPADIVSDGTPVLPVFSSVVAKFGRTGRDGIRPFAFAFSTLQPNTSAWRAVIDMRSESPAIQDSLVIEEVDRQVWYGGSFAFRINPRISLGLTAFLATRSFRHTEGITRIEEGTNNPDRGTLENPYFTVSETLAEISTWHAIFRVGALWQPTPRWRVGVMLQPPGIQVRGEGRVRERTSFADLLADPGYATFYLSDQRDLPVSTPSPWQIRLGAAVQVSQTVTMAADVNLTGPAGTAASPIQPIDIMDLEVLDGKAPEPGYFYTRTYRTEYTLDAALGFEWCVHPHIPLRIGAFTSLASTPDIPMEVFHYVAPHIDSYGGSMAIGYDAGDYDLTLGVAGQYGGGDAVAYNPAGTGSGYSRTTAEAWSLHIFVGGYRRAASTLARRTAARIRDRRRERTTDSEMNAPASSSSEPSPPQDSESD